MIALIALFAGAASAQDIPVPDINAQLYRPVVDAKQTLWANDSGAVRDQGQFLARGALHYVNRPLVFRPDNDGDPTVLVSDALQFDAIAAYHVDRFRFAVDLPVYLVSAGQLTQNGAGFGDIAIDTRATILDREKTPVGVAVTGRMTLPTSTVEAPLGSPGLGGELEAIVDRQFSDKLLATVNLGTRFLPSTDELNISQNDQFYFRLGGGYALTEKAGISLDLAGQANYSQPLSERANLPMEALVGGWGRLDDNVVLRGGVGTGITPGVGSPPLRLLIMVGYEPIVSRDLDGDGLVDKVDACPANPEDFDNFQDDDGCPDLDNDNDGVLDAADQCPLEPEDADGYKDDDGCPDPSTKVHVTIKDDKGNLLTAATGFVQDGEQRRTDAGGDVIVDLHEGSYDLFAEAKGFLQSKKPFAVPTADGKNEIVLVLYPDVPMGTLKLRVVNGEKQAIDGAVWTMDNNAGNAFADGAALMTVPAGKHAIDVRAPGYVSSRLQMELPRDKTTELVVELKPSQVKVSKERIDIKGTIYFEVGSDKIKKESFGLLDDVAATLIDNPDISKVLIEGHTDSRGSNTSNQSLSARRAKSVLEYMKKVGVTAERLESIGFGESCPIDPREVAEAWDKNRRVDFFIIGREGKEVPSASTCKQP